MTAAAEPTKPADGEIDLGTLLRDILGYRDDEFGSILRLDGGTPSSVVAPAGEIATTAARFATSSEALYFGVNPTAGPARTGQGRGRSEDATRLAGLFADVDVKPGACPNIDVARAVIAELSIPLDSRPAAIIYSGGGLQPLWPVEDGDDPAAGRALLTRWGRAVAAVGTKNHGINLDNVSDMARMLRVPGSVNTKYGEPRPVVAVRDAGRPLSTDELAERFDEWGIEARTEDDAPSASEPVSASAKWQWGGATCGYVAKMIGGWATDTPKDGRNPWLLSQRVRLNCAHRLGCITEADYRRADAVLTKRFAEIVADPRYGQPRPVKRLEHSDTHRCAVRKVEAKSDDAARAELGAHQHPGDTSGATSADEFFGGTSTGEADPGAQGTGDGGTRSQGGDDRPNRKANVQWASQIRPKRQVWLWGNRIPAGTLSAFSGRGGCGKSTFAINIAAQMSQGTLPGEHFGKPQRVLIWSGEDDWDTVMVPG